MTVLTGRQGRHGRPRRRLFYVALAVALAALVVGAVLFLVTRGGDEPAAPPGSREPVERVAPGAPPGWPSWGLTHTQNSADGPSGGQVDAVRGLLARQPVTQNQHIMGWGADNPEPAPGRYQFSSLDRRMDVIRKTRGTPVITLCCAPDWMKGGAAGQTDWTKLEVAPRPEHYDDFARLAAQVARRYPDVKHYTVWNEFKGFFDETSKRWRYEDYTALYNKVYTALKEVDPEIKVGGPYLVMASHAPNHPAAPSKVRGDWGSLDPRVIDAVEYWTKHKKGADFIVVDGHAQPDEKSVVLDEFEALAKFSAVSRWLREEGGGLPVWWAEWYTEPEGANWTYMRRSAVLATAMIEFVRGGAATALYWNPQTAAGDCAGCLWTGAARPTPDLDMLQNFARWFPPGTQLQDVRSPVAKVRVLAQPKQMVVVNTGDRPVRVAIGDERLALKPYEVRWTARR